ncbi:MAG: cupin [Candidatus Dactylopiibacterium carminicum]|uniref:Cupin n=1 Tax=Candidatus Dactylopiibacterium carminicum TaxID=857335 RepID=A0A272ENN0_9RHOO|nr:cupin domain-containing protein [Candidatus Dactylopiibacterium carminicum]KAF7598103.1 DUF861 domain-containing protein [Candidatus Dactylopiibacterium carminicum]PAS91727.1 MAG: cupin [Candidatus Dactylopiibacterium carminicum]PAS93867.1 MAG: cupin [Candidatus Dactylopiibacterium carminicum]PAS96620.1 MAG: cupin [Candidatus Dactylopiibacterium carminicum]
MSSEQQIVIERQVDAARREALGVVDWPVWEKEISEFPWFYDSSETCCLIAGEVVVTPEGGEPVTLRTGDLATFPVGTACTWRVVAPLRKHYCFG